MTKEARGLLSGLGLEQICGGHYETLNFYTAPAPDKPTTLSDHQRKNTHGRENPELETLHPPLGSANCDPHCTAPAGHRRPPGVRHELVPADHQGWPQYEDLEHAEVLASVALIASHPRRSLTPTLLYRVGLILSSVPHIGGGNKDEPFESRLWDATLCCQFQYGVLGKVTLQGEEKYTSSKPGSGYLRPCWAARLKDWMAEKQPAGGPAATGFTAVSPRTQAAKTHQPRSVSSSVRHTAPGRKSKDGSRRTGPGQ
ncbi:uncharacterized protein LOC129145120 [Talpa occidentalis]|uniref:uncharacterized protein LOC129145120 n=1 Tax=Talpa occidentalis TaxID=50954 RepID=UPI0023F6BBEA|nr:uncharacterized protein LOC129145120 [Talpa occidentalis]